MKHAHAKHSLQNSYYTAVRMLIILQSKEVSPSKRLYVFTKPLKDFLDIKNKYSSCLDVKNCKCVENVEIYSHVAPFCASATSVHLNIFLKATWIHWSGFHLILLIQKVYVNNVLN